MVGIILYAKDISYLIRCFILTVIMISYDCDLTDHKKGISHDEHGREGKKLHQPLVHYLKINVTH